MRCGLRSDRIDIYFEVPTGLAVIHPELEIKLLAFCFYVQLQSI